MNEKEINILDLKVGDHFEDSQIYTLQHEELLAFIIIGDHLFLLTDGYNVALICSDDGNGHGTVLMVINYLDLYRTHFPHVKANITETNEVNKINKISETDEMKNQKMLNFWPFA